MKRNAIRSLVVMMITVMVFALTPVPVSAASKAPGKVKIKSLKVAAVSATTNNTTVTIKWKKAKKATGYIIYAKHGTGDWVKQKKVGRMVTKFKLLGVPAGQLDIKIQAVNKKKKGKFSAVKSKYITSPHTLASYVNNIRPSWKYAEYGITPTFSGNTVTYDIDVAKVNRTSTLTDEQLELIKTKVNSEQAAMKNEALQFIKSRRLDEGIPGVVVKYRYIYNNNSFLNFTFQ